MYVVGLFVQSGDPRLKNLTLEAEDIGLSVHRVDIFLELSHSYLQVFHFVFDIVNGAVEGLLLRFVVTLDLFELRLQVLLLLELWSQLVLLLFNLLREFFDLFVDLFHGGVGQVGFGLG